MTTEIVVLQEIKTVPATIKFDFEGTKARLDARLEPFKNVVTEDTIKQAKSEKAEINRIKASIDDARKIESANATVEVREFDLKMRELMGLCVDGYNLLNDQIIKFESVVKERLLGFLVDNLNDAWDGLRVEPEFRRGSVDHLALLSNCNDAGIPNKKTKETVKQIAMNDLALQQKVEMRLMQLENAGLKNGVSGLKRVHVEGFLFADDDVYGERLAALIAEEVKREHDLKAKFFAESNLIHDDERQEMAAAAGVVIPDSHAHEFETLPPQPEKIKYEIIAIFEAQVDSGISPEYIAENAKRQFFEKAGFKNLKSIEVKKV